MNHAVGRAGNDRVHRLPDRMDGSNRRPDLAMAHEATPAVSRARLWGSRFGVDPHAWDYRAFRARDWARRLRPRDRRRPAPMVERAREAPEAGRPGDRRRVPSGP